LLVDKEAVRTFWERFYLGCSPEQQARLDALTEMGGQSADVPDDGGRLGTVKTHHYAQNGKITVRKAGFKPNL